MHARQRQQELDSRILSAVYGAIDDVNQLLPAQHQLAKSLDEPILGPTGALDSMGFVNLIAAIEERIAAELRMTLNLVDRQAPRGMFNTVGALVTYISQLLASKTEQSIR